MIIPPISLADYHAHAALSKSKLDEFDVSPRRYWWRYVAGNRGGSTANMRRGSAFHALMEGGPAFAKRYVVLPAGLKNDERTNAWQSWAAMAAIGDREVLTNHQARTAMSMRDAVMANREARQLIDLCTPEVTARWIDDETGLELQARPDGWSATGCELSRGRRFCIDYKSTADARRWIATAIDSHHNRSAAMMQRGMSTAAPFADPPHSVVVYEADTEFINSGWHGIVDAAGFPIYGNDGRPVDVGCMALIDRLAECKATDTWPRDPETVWPLGLPRWITKQQEAKA